MILLSWRGFGCLVKPENLPENRRRMFVVVGVLSFFGHKIFIIKDLDSVLMRSSLTSSEHLQFFHPPLSLHQFIPKHLLQHYKAPLEGVLAPFLLLKAINGILAGTVLRVASCHAGPARPRGEADVSRILSLCCCFLRGGSGLGACPGSRSFYGPQRVGEPAHVLLGSLLAQLSRKPGAPASCCALVSLPGRALH